MLRVNVRINNIHNSSSRKLQEASGVSCQSLQGKFLVTFALATTRTSTIRAVSELGTEPSAAVQCAIILLGAWCTIETEQSARAPGIE